MEFLDYAEMEGHITAAQSESVRSRKRSGEGDQEALVRLGVLDRDQVEVLEQEFLNRPVQKTVIDESPGRFGLSTGDDPESGAWWASGRFHIERTLGEGAMAKVYLATDTRIDERVVIKVMKRMQGLGFEGGYARFRREMYALSEIAHPRIAHLLDAGKVDVGNKRIPWYTTTFMNGEALSDWARNREVSLAWALTRVARLGEACGACHDIGLVHRDIKPDNILVIDEGQDVCLIDFGLVKILEGAESFLISTGEMVGTPAFMAPEQIDIVKDGVNLPMGGHTDVYALGGVLLWLLTRYVPNPVEGPMTLGSIDRAIRTPPPSFAPWPHLDAGIEEICHKALAFDPANRYRDGGEMALAIEGYLEGRHDAPLHLLQQVGRPEKAPIPLDDGLSIGGALFDEMIEGYSIRSQEGMHVTLNGEPVRTTILIHGDRIRLEDEEFVYLKADD